MTTPKSQLIQRVFLDVQNDRCVYCSCTIKRQDRKREKIEIERTYLERLATWDHVVPVSKGGKNTICNVVLVCSVCNHDKADRMPTAAQYAKASGVIWEVVRELMGMNPSNYTRKKLNRKKHEQRVQLKLLVGGKLSG